MATGSDIDAAPVFRERLHLNPDRPEELQAAGILVFAEVSRSSFSLLTVNVSALKAVAFRSFEFPYCVDDERWAATVAHIQKEIGAQHLSTLVVCNVPCSIIPSDLYRRETETINQILRLEHGELSGNNAVDALMDVWDAHCVVLIPNAILQLFSSIRILPTLICWSSSLLQSPSAHHAHAYISEREFTLAVLRGRELILHNDFTHQTPEDVLYFCMATMEQLSILHSEVQFTLYGNVEEDDALHRLFKRYIVQVVFGEKPTALKYSYSFKELLGHRMPFILNAPLCAS